jgi:hypothetical protein
MNFTLVRVSIQPGGAFGVLLSEHGLPFCVTLERVFEERGATGPVIPAGKYKCVESFYRKGGYPTYEVTGVKGHDRLLFHRGNYEKDSEGCILVARTFEGDWVSDSTRGFERFMQRLNGAPTFDLTVLDPREPDAI